MQRISELMRDKACEMLSAGKADRVLAWESGDLYSDRTPAFFGTTKELDNLVYDSFCGGNLSKYLIAQKKKDEKVLAFLKPCDTYSFIQLINEHRVDRDKVCIIGVGCNGMLDGEKIRNLGVKGILAANDKDQKVIFETVYGEKILDRSDILLEKCTYCKGKKHMVFDELIGASEEEEDENAPDRFAGVAQIEDETSDERFSFWRRELSKCIRCNACRNICPACSCIKCVFDNPKSGVSAKSNVTEFEENLFHIIRAFHVAGRCTDCGECSRVCPQGIPLHLLNRKMIKDINTLYGSYQAGAEVGAVSPLTAYTQDDAEPGIVAEGGLYGC